MASRLSEKKVIDKLARQEENEAKLKTNKNYLKSIERKERKTTQKIEHCKFEKQSLMQMSFFLLFLTGTVK